MKFLILILIFLTSCSHNKRESETKNLNTFSYFSFKDLSGEYIVKREVNLKNSKIALRQTLFLPGNEIAPLEKSVSVASLGFIKTNNSKVRAIRPVASQYSIWFEKKEFFSQFKLNIKKKGLDLYLKSPEKKWQGTQFISLPKSSKFCWYSQVPECLKKIAKLERKSRQPIHFFIIWDNFPYNGEQYEGASTEAFSAATVAFDAKVDKTYRFSVSVNQQLIFYHYNFDLEFERMVWIAQGITMIKQSREGML